MLLILLITLKYCQALPYFYHTTQDLDRQLELILRQCKVPHKISLHDTLKVLHFNHKSESQSLIVFGEHPRELITVETGLALLKDLCSSLRQNGLVMILNMSPDARKHVESGHYCLRENTRGVDLNRNYDIAWKYIEDHAQQVSSGPYPFSELSTKTVQKLIQENTFQRFISVHSGANAILFPFAYKFAEVEHMPSEIHSIRDKYCPECLVGGAARTIGYRAGGCSMDYAYSNGIEYSYTLEIWDAYMSKKEPKSTYLEFLENKIKSEVTFEDTHCFQFFNPTTIEQYHSNLKRWTLIINSLLDI